MGLQPNTYVYSDEVFDRQSFRERCLIGYEFVRCAFRSCDFRGADLSYARFRDCDHYRTSWKDSVLYATWFVDCNLTKADFRGAYLLGVRFQNVDVTKTSFDSIPAVGRQRKPVPSLSSSRSFAGGEQMKMSAVKLERVEEGIERKGFDRAIVFIDDPEGEPWHQHSRVAETARYLRMVFSANHYADQARHYHVVERQHARRARPSGFRQGLHSGLEWVFQDLLWRYGTSPWRPLIAVALWSAIWTAIFLLIPTISPSLGGMRDQAGVLLALSGNAGVLWTCFYALVTAPLGGEGGTPVGLGQLAFLVYAVGVLVLLAIAFEASVRTLGHSE